LLTKHARSDLTDVLDSTGQLSWSKAKAKRLLKKLKTKTRTDKDGNITVEHEYEIHDPQAALEKLGKFHKLFTEKEVEVSLSEADVARLGESLLNVMLEAAQRKRLAGESDAGQLDVVGMDAATTGDSGGPTGLVIDVTAASKTTDDD
jgi:hypothetical protein